MIDKTSWSKLFKNGERISEPASWSRTKLTGMIGVELVFNDQLAAIYGNGQYWQSDTFAIDVVADGSPKPVLLTRRVQILMDAPAIAYCYCSEFATRIDFRLIDDKFDMFIDCEPYIGQWLTIEIDRYLKWPTVKIKKERM